MELVLFSIATEGVLLIAWGLLRALGGKEGAIAAIQLLLSIQTATLLVLIVLSVIGIAIQSARM